MTMRVEDWFVRVGSVAFVSTLALTAAGFFFTRWATAVPHPEVSGEVIHSIRPVWAGWAMLLGFAAFAWGVGSVMGFFAARAAPLRLP